MLLRILLCFLFLITSAYSKDWFDMTEFELASAAEEIFDVDFFEVEKAMVIGNNSKGIVLCVWMSEAYNGIVLTKTLKKDIRQTKDNSNNGPYYNSSIYDIYNQIKEDEEPETVDALIEKIYEIVNAVNWELKLNRLSKTSLLFDEELKLVKIYDSLSSQRTDNNYIDIFTAISKGIETEAERGVRYLYVESSTLYSICNNDSICKDTYKNFIENLKYQYDDIRL